jgi:hypothetical protein
MFLIDIENMKPGTLSSICAHCEKQILSAFDICEAT